MAPAINKHGPVIESDDEKARGCGLDHLLREGLSEVLAFELRSRKKRRSQTEN